MYFLIEYSRKEGKLIKIKEFQSVLDAKTAKLESDIKSLENNLTSEVVILEAESIEALKKSHGRYFGDIRSIHIK